MAGNIYRCLFIGYIKEGKEEKFMISTNDCQLQKDGDIQHVQVYFGMLLPRMVIFN